VTELRRILERTRSEGRAALVPFLTAGDPDLATTVDFACALVEGGADILELGVPFSDPLADGPVIQRATERALAQGIRVPDVLDCAREIHRRCGVPIVAMSYLNPLLRYGWDRFAAEAPGAGIVGVILTDVPPEEADAFLPAAAEHGLGTVFLVAPTSGEERIRHAAEITTGFLYCVTRLGVTGGRTSLSDAFRPVLETVRRVSDIPVGLGFGISTADHARAAGKDADAVIVGSALVAAAESAESPAAAADALRRTARELRTALGEARGSGA
jgi:tryptophan synthase alpha chain